MSTSSFQGIRRKLLFAGGAGLLGIASILTARITKRGSRGVSESEAKRLARQISLPGDGRSMMQAFARDPKKVKRFQELTRWRKMRDKELSRV